MTIPVAGTTPAGFFIPVLFVAPGAPTALLADPIDFETGEYLSIERGYDPTDAAVMTALRTVRASGSAVEDVGQKFREHQLVDLGLPTFFREEVSFALRHLVDSGQIRLLSVAVVTLDDTGEVQIHYINVARSQDRKIVAPLTQLLPRAA